MWPWKKTKRIEANILVCAECGRPTLCQIHNHWVQATMRLDDLEAKHDKLYREWLRKEALRDGAVPETLHAKKEGNEEGGTAETERGGKGTAGKEGNEADSTGDKAATAKGKGKGYKDSLRHNPTVLE